MTTEDLVNLSNSSLLVRGMKSLVITFVFTVNSLVKVILPVIFFSPPIVTYLPFASVLVNMVLSMKSLL